MPTVPEFFSGEKIKTFQIGSPCPPPVGIDHFTSEVFQPFPCRSSFHCGNIINLIQKGVKNFVSINIHPTDGTGRNTGHKFFQRNFGSPQSKLVVPNSWKTVQIFQRDTERVRPFTESSVSNHGNIIKERGAFVKPLPLFFFRFPYSPSPP